MLFCVECIFQGYCGRLKTSLVSDEELSESLFLNDVRRHANSLSFSPNDWLDKLSDYYRDYPGAIIDSGGKEVFLKLEVFEAPFIREWFRDWACSPPSFGKTPRLNSRSKERIRVLATVLRATYPARASLWGVIIANDQH